MPLVVVAMSLALAWWVERRFAVTHPAGSAHPGPVPAAAAHPK
jgi:hypothetical protein